MKTARTILVAAALFIASLVLVGLNYHPGTPTYTPGDTLPAIVGETAPEQVRQIRHDGGGAVIRQNPEDPFIEAAYFGGVHLPGDIFQVEQGRAEWTHTDYADATGHGIPVGDTELPEGIYMINDAGELVSLGQESTE